MQARGEIAQFMCGFEDHDGAKDGQIVGDLHLVENDPTLLNLAGIRDDHETERTAVGAPWVPSDLTVL